MDAYDKYDYEMCGENQPTTMISEGPRLVMIFASGDSQGRGFKAKYTFETGTMPQAISKIKQKYR